MTIEAIDVLLHDRPFRSFTLHLADQRKLKVDHPEQVAHNGGRTLVVVQSDRAHVLDIFMIVSAELTGNPPSPPAPPKRTKTAK